MATAEYTFIGSERSSFTREWNQKVTVSQFNQYLGNLIPKYARLTNVNIILEWKTSLSSAAEYRLYIAGAKVGDTCEAWNKYFRNEHSGLQGFFLSETEHPSIPIGDVEVNLSASIVRTFYIRLYKIVYEYDNPVFVVSLQKTGEGTVGGAGTYEVGTNATITATPASGYKFVKWSDGNANASRTVTVASGSQTAFSTPLSYTAIFEKEEVPYTVTYNVNGATSGSIANTTAYRDTDFSLPTGLKKQYTVTMNPNYLGTTATQVQCSATFNGWEDHGTITASNGETFTKDTFDAPLYANSFSDLYDAFKYNKQALVNHWVNFGVNESHRFCTGSPRGVYNKTNVVSNLADAGGTAILCAQWGDMSAVTLPSPTRDGYTFIGWYTAAESGTKAGEGGGSYTPSGNITLYAHWKLNEITDIYVGTSILDAYIGTSKYDVYQGATKIYG